MKVIFQEEIECMYFECFLYVVIVLLLILNGNIIGILKMYFKNLVGLSQVEEEFVEGLVMLFLI